MTDAVKQYRCDTKFLAYLTNLNVVLPELEVLYPHYLSHAKLLKERKAAERRENAEREAQKANEEAAQRANAEAAQRANEEAALKANAEAALRANEEAALKANEEAAQRANAEAAQRANEEAALKANAEAAQRANAEAAQRANEEAAQDHNAESLREAEWATDFALFCAAEREATIASSDRSEVPEQTTQTQLLTAQDQLQNAESLRERLRESEWATEKAWRNFALFCAAEREADIAYKRRRLDNIRKRKSKIERRAARKNASRRRGEEPVIRSDEASKLKKEKNLWLRKKKPWRRRRYR